MPVEISKIDLISCLDCSNHDHCNVVEHSLDKAKLIDEYVSIYSMVTGCDLLGENLQDFEKLLKRVEKMACSIQGIIPCLGCKVCKKTDEHGECLNK